MKPNNNPQSQDPPEAKEPASAGCMARLVRLVESAIRSQDGKMILDICVDDELLEQIRLTIQKNIEWDNGEKFAVESAIRNVFSEHEIHMTQAATDDANMGLRRALDSLPNA